MTVEIDTTQVDRARQLARKVARNARDKNEWRKIVKVRLWMPVALQVLLIVVLLWYTETRFDGFINRANITTILLLAMPLALAAIAQTHAILVGYLDLSVGAMISFGVVVGSFLIGGDASLVEILIGIAAILACGLGLGLVNAVLIRGFKIPSLIATLATLSILDGISLTLRPTAQGIISDDLVSFLRTSVGPIPIAFILIVVGAGLLDLWLHASGSGLEVRAVGFDERVGQARRHQDQLDLGCERSCSRASSLPWRRCSSWPARRSAMPRSGARSRSTASPPPCWAGRRSPAAGRPSSGAPWPPFCSPSSSPHSRSSDCHPPTAR